MEQINFTCVITYLVNNLPLVFIDCASWTHALLHLSLWFALNALTQHPSLGDIQIVLNYLSPMALRTRGMYFMYLGHTNLLVKICKYMCAFEEGNLIRLKCLKSQRIMKHQLDLLLRFLKMPSALWRILEHWWVDISLNVWLKKKSFSTESRQGTCWESGTTWRKKWTEELVVMQL